METKKITRSSIGEHLFDYQLQMVGKTRMNIIDDDRWRFNITMTREQREQFKKYAVPLLMKTFRINRTKAVYNYEWFIQMFGVRLKG